MPPEGVPIKRSEPLSSEKLCRKALGPPDVGALFELLGSREQSGSDLTPVVQVLVGIVAEVSSTLRADIAYYREQCRAKDEKIADLEGQIAGLLARSSLSLGPVTMTIPGETTT